MFVYVRVCLCHNYTKTSEPIELTCCISYRSVLTSRKAFLSKTSADAQSHSLISRWTRGATKCEYNKDSLPCKHWNKCPSSDVNLKFLTHTTYIGGLVIVRAVYDCTFKRTGQHFWNIFTRQTDEMLNGRRWCTTSQTTRSVPRTKLLTAL